MEGTGLIGFFIKTTKVLAWGDSRWKEWVETQTPSNTACSAPSVPGHCLFRCSLAHRLFWPFLFSAFLRQGAIWPSPQVLFLRQWQWQIMNTNHPFSPASSSLIPRKAYVWRCTYMVVPPFLSFICFSSYSTAPRLPSSLVTSKRSQTRLISFSSVFFPL